MNTLLLAIFLMAVSGRSFGQDSLSRHDLKITFKLKVKPFPLAGKTAISTVPDTMLMDDCNRFAYGLRNFPKRYEYLLFSSFPRANFDAVYPDVDKIQALYIDSLVANKTFVEALEATTFHICDDDSSEKIGVNESQLLDIASQFFYCSNINKDSSINWFICVGINGLQGLHEQWSYQQRVVAAFCFEAIFEKFKRTRSPKFERSFKKYIDAESKAFRTGKFRDQDYIGFVRANVFARMAADKHLKKSLLTHYAKNQDNLSFIIK